MSTTFRSIWQTLVPLWLFVACALLQSACSCQSAKARSTKPAACIAQHEKLPVAKALESPTLAAGFTPYAFVISGSGAPNVAIDLVAPPGRTNLAPDLQLRYAGPQHEGAVGNFELAGASSITHCPKSSSVDGEIDSVHFSDDDALCLNGQKLVEVARAGETIQYALWPDGHIKVVKYLPKNKDSYFVAFYPSGEVISFGKTAGSRPTTGNVPIAWLADEQRDARGNTLQYGYCFATNGDDVREYALDEVRYGFSGDSAQSTRVVSLVYGQDEHARTTFEGGHKFQRSLKLDEVQMSVDSALVRRYVMTYDRSEATNRRRLVTVQECAGKGNNECKVPTRFHYGEVEQGFVDVTTTLGKPLSNHASPMLGDFMARGQLDWLVGDTVAISTTMNPITEWRLARNTGNGFGPESVAFLQEWPVSDASNFDDPSQTQPDLGSLVDYDQDGSSDIYLHEVTGTKNNHIIFRNKGDGTFEEVDTQIPRPFPLGPAPEGLRSSVGAVHLADVTGDSVVDLIACSDHGDTPVTALLSTWTLHAWRPGGFDPQGVVIDTLSGISCGTRVQTIDLNNDSVTDLVLPGFLRQGGVPVEPSGNYSVHRRRTDGTWEVIDTGLSLTVDGGPVLFADVNGDGLPDAIYANSTGYLQTQFNTGQGFSKFVEKSFQWDPGFPQASYFDLAIAGDFNGDGRMDLFMPLLDVNHSTIPYWVILYATDEVDGYTFQPSVAGIPFEPEIGDVVKLADPRMPRIADMTGDGADDVLILLGNQWHLFKNRGADPDLLVAISDGRNDHDPDEPEFIPNVSITYDHLRDKSDLYDAHDDPANGCAYPRHCLVAPMRVVREYALDDGAGGQRKFGLRYRDGRYDKSTNEFLGFGKRFLTDLDTRETTVDFYGTTTKVMIGEREVYPFVGQIQKQWQWAADLPSQPNPAQIEMVFADRTMDVVPSHGNQSFFTLATRMHTRRVQGTHSGPLTLEEYVALVEVQGNETVLKDSTVEVLDYDEYGNVLEVDVSTEGVDAGMHVTRTVKNDVGKWLLGLPDTQTECSTGGGLTQCRTITRTVNEFGEVETEATSSSDGIDDTKLLVTYKRDKYGHVTGTHAEDAFGHVRESTTVYDNEGFFPSKQINALGHVTLVEYDRALGVMIKETDPNGLTTERKFDEFGRLTSEARPDGSSTRITRSREKVNGQWRTKERTTTTGGGDDEVVFDSLGRTIFTFGHGPEPKANIPRIEQRVEYDRLSGEVAQKSVPIAEGTPDAEVQWDTYEFDAMGREIRHTTPWNAVTTTQYDGFFVHVTDPLLRKTTTEMDPLGRTKRITDAVGGVTTYTYGPFDAVRSVADPGQDVTTWTRDAFGRVRRLDDANRGTTTLVHDGFGDLVSSRDALGRTSTWTFDTLGRTTSRVDVDAGKTLTTTWTWDTAPHGRGALHKLTNPDVMKTYSYTARGQIESVVLATGNDAFAAHMAYDEFGRLKSTQYPQPLGQEPFGVTHEYDAFGFRVVVRDSATEEAYWELTDVDHAGRTREEVFGNGTKTQRMYDQAKPTLQSITTTHGATTIQQLSYTWDDVLELKSRTDLSQPQNKTERFRYDGLQRLTCAYFSPTENPGASCATAYAYAPNGNLSSKSDMGALTYDDPKHPHAVTGAAGETYVHNAVGNQILRPGGMSITYTPFDLPKTIQQGASVVSLGYDGNEQRIRKTTATSETLYFEDLFEQVTAGAVQEFRYYVFSPERAVAVVTRGGNEPGTQYLHVDHLQSIESVTKNDGSIAEKRSYDAFGAKRNTQWGMPGGLTSGKTTKGFTGHEEDDEFGLVNMRGRLYDPRIARFTTPDPVIANIFDGQSLNGFSYVWNNPLAFVDPTGFVPDAPQEDGEFYYRTYATDDPLGFVLVYWRKGEAEPDLKTFLQGRHANEFGAAAPTTDVGTTGAAGAVQKSAEGIGSFIEGMVKGSLSDNDSWSATLGSVVAGFIPGVGLAADIRDLGAAVSHVVEGRQGAWYEVGAAVIGFAPGGDIAKGIAKSATKAMGRTAVKVGAELVDDAAKVLKGSTAAAADGLSSAQKTAGKVHAPRGPPNKYGSRGGPEHRAVVEQRIEDLKAQGHTHTHGGPLREESIRTKGGVKDARRPDITTLAPDRTIYRENVGLVNKSGQPIKRERDALDDIEAFKGRRPGFTPYYRK